MSEIKKENICDYYERHGMGSQHQVGVVGANMVEFLREVADYTHDTYLKRRIEIFLQSTPWIGL